MNTYDHIIASINGAPLVEWDGYESQALALNTTAEYHILRKNTTYRLTALGDDMHVALLSPEQVDNSKTISNSNTLLLIDGESTYVTTTGDLERREDPLTPTGYYVLGAKARDGSGTLQVTIMRERRSRNQGK